MSKSSFLSGFLLGGILGAVVMLLYTPESGEDVRGQARGYVKNLGSEIKAAAEARRDQLEAELASLRSPRSSE